MKRTFAQFYMANRTLIALLKKEFLLEFRQKSTLGGVAVYVVSTVFVSALCFKKIIHPQAWTALFWVILLFASVNVASKSFIQETRGRGLFNYLYYSPRQFILSKVIYNMIFMAALSLVTLFFYSWFVGSLVQDLGLFLLTLVLSAAAFSGVLSVMSAIAAKASGNFSLMAILSFPVLMPMLMVAIKLSKNAVDGLAWSVSYNYLLILAALNVIVIMLANLLFPYLWRD